MKRCFLHRMSSSGDVDDGIAELRQLLEVGFLLFTACHVLLPFLPLAWTRCVDPVQVGWSQESPSITASLGVSPPVRSGAANPLHTLHAAQAAVACRSNLKALQELQSSQRSPVAACPGDYRLLIASPDFDGGVLTNDVAASSSRPSPPVILNRTQQKDRCSSSNASWSATQASPPEAGIFGYWLMMILIKIWHCAKHCFSYVSKSILVPCRFVLI